MNDIKIGIVGFGEAGQAFAAGWTLPDGAVLSAYDVKIANPVAQIKLREACSSLGVDASDSAFDALSDATTIFSLVTADQVLAAAKAAASVLNPGALFYDCNSCAPSTKVEASKAIEAAGGRYVDVAVMSPVHPLGAKAPLLVSGPHAASGMEVLLRLGMRPKAAGDRVGQASSIKMLRSIMVKGLEALTAESMLAARRAGVEDAVIASLQASDPGIDWAKRCAYNLERMMVHGARRAAEMREVALTVRDLGLADRMSIAIADWQDEIAAFSVSVDKDDVAGIADSILIHIDGATTGKVTAGP